MKLNIKHRQGDVYLKETNNIPKNAKETKTNILAEGEVTGHKHQVIGNALTYITGDGTKYLEVRGAAKLVHEEHGAQELTKGKYEIKIQREYDPVEGIQQVTD